LTYSQADTYSRPPWPFRGAEQISVIFDAVAEGLNALVPPPLEIDVDHEGLVRCEIRVCWYPWSAYGPFHETYLLVRARHHGELVWFLPVIMTDNEAPLAGGREVWGYAKKIAHMSWRFDQNTAGQVLFTMERPAGQRLLTVTFAPQRRASPAERVGYHVMSHRHITSSSGTISELVLLGGSKAVRRSASGDLDLWFGSGSVTLGGGSSADPWHLARPVRVHGAFWQISDFALEPGRVVDDLSANAPSL
jgi:acetoacetate decarboxylase